MCVSVCELVCEDVRGVCESFVLCLFLGSALRLCLGVGRHCNQCLPLTVEDPSDRSRHVAVCNIDSTSA